MRLDDDDPNWPTWPTSRFADGGGALQTLCSVDGDALERMRRWLDDSPYELWPQQHPIRGEARPAMLNDPSWRLFGEVSRPIVGSIMLECGRRVVVNGYVFGERAADTMLSAIMPGHDIDEHCDRQAPSWRARVHIPIISNQEAVFRIGGAEHVMLPGFAYLVDVRQLHYVVNRGATPRVHLMFDIHSR